MFLTVFEVLVLFVVFNILYGPSEERND